MDQILDLVTATRDVAGGPGGLALLGVAFFVISLTFLPRPPACIVAGAVYGLAAFPVVLAASTLGAVAGFLMSRHLLQARFRAMIARRSGWRRIADAVDSQGFVLALLLRLASPVPGSATTYIFGLSGMRLVPYAVATFLGLTPQTFLFVAIGAAGQQGALSGSPLRLALVFAGVATTAAVIFLVTARARALLAMRLTPDP